MRGAAVTGRGREMLVPVLALVVLGALWGSTQSLSKIAVSEGYRGPGLVFWQLALGAVFLGALNLVRGKGLPWGRGPVTIYLVIALIGTILPNTASYEAIRHLPAGLVSILLSLIPLMAFPIALAMGNERFSGLRLGGLLLGLVGVMLIVAPEASLPERAMVMFIPLALVAPFFYALEGNVVGKWGTAGLDPIQVLLGGSILGSAIALPVAVLTGTFIDPRPPWGLPDAAMLAGAVIHAMAYSGYVWLVGRAGAVFAVQVSYLVTGFGVFWALLILEEVLSGWIWAAMALMLAGVFLVQPRRREILAPGLGAGEDAV